MTRPRKTGESNRDLVVRARFTLAEKNRLLELAAQAGLTASDFLRVRTLEAKPQTHKATPDRAALIRLTAELNKVGSNLNQVARALNRREGSDDLGGYSLNIINAALQDVKFITAQIAKELGHGHSG